MSSTSLRRRRVTLAVLLASALALRLLLAALVPGYPYDTGTFTAWSNALVENGPANFYTAGFFADYPPGYMYFLWATGLLARAFGFAPMSSGALVLMLSLIHIYSRVYGYGYTNAAHYNILLYLLYALWELPLYLIERIGGFVFTDLTLSLWCKWLGAGFYLGCGLLTGALARRLGCEETACRWVPLFFWLNPISFFTILVMGQYDSICLFFLLWALIHYLDGRMIPFSLVIGVGMVFKFFPVFLLLPLVLAILGMLLIVLVFYRSLSRKIVLRRAENEKFLSLWYRLRDMFDRRGRSSGVYASSSFHTDAGTVSYTHLRRWRDTPRP